MGFPQNVIITGASGGIGAALAVMLAPDRRLVLSYRGNERAAAMVRGKCLADGAIDVRCLHLDLRSDASMEDFAGEALIDIEEPVLLLHNAGVIVKERLNDQTYDDLYLQMAVNAVGPQILTKRLLGMLSHVAFIGSDVGVRAIPGMPVYCASKYAIRGFARALALDFPFLSVSCINPDRTATGMNDRQGRSIIETANAIHFALLGIMYPDVSEGNFREYHLDKHLAPLTT